MDAILVLASAAAFFVQILTGIVRMKFGLEGWLVPALAIAIGIVIAFLLSVYLGEVLTPQVIAKVILAGIVAGGGAVAQTELQKRQLGPQRSPSDVH